VLNNQDVSFAKSLSTFRDELPRPKNTSDLVHPDGATCVDNTDSVHTEDRSLAGRCTFFNLGPRIAKTNSPIEHQRIA